MAPKCTDCYYCRRGTIITYQPAYTCLHPLVMQMDALARIPALCDTVRQENAACGREGALFQPAVDNDGPQPIHLFRQ